VTWSFFNQTAVRFIDLKYPQGNRLPHGQRPRSCRGLSLATPTTPSRPPPCKNFSIAEIQKAATDPGTYDTALIFSTKWEPPANHQPRPSESIQRPIFDFHHDVSPAEAAVLLHGDIVWQAHARENGQAVLLFPRIVEAALIQPPTR